MKNIPVSWPTLNNKEISSVTKVLKEGWLGLGSYVEIFEKKLEKFLKNKKKFVCCVSTGSDALLMSLMIAKVNRGDEVILPSLNFIAGAQAIKFIGAKPVFCDVEEKTLCLDVNKASKLINKKTKAIIAVDYSGNLVDYEALHKIKKKYKKIRIIQDAAHSFGSVYKNKRVGTFTDIVMFSFDPIKTITSIDGGAIVVNTKKELNELKAIRQLGFAVQPNVAFSSKKKIISDVQLVGLQNRMTNVHAAIGIEQMKKIDQILTKKKKLAKNYNRLFKNNSNIKIPNSDFNNVVPFIYYIRVKKQYRDNLRKFLRTKNILTGLHWTPNHIYSLFKKDRKGSMQITNNVAQELISLPYYTNLKYSQQVKVCDLINVFFKKKNRTL